MEITVATNETTYAITLGQLKDFLKVDGGDEDALLSNLLIAAHDMVVQYTGRSLTTRTLDVYYDKWQSSFDLPYGPVQSITHMKYYDTTGSEGTVNSSVYYLAPGNSTSYAEKYPGQTYPQSILRGKGGIVLRYVTGYGDDPNDVPFLLRQAVLQTAAAMYENRETAELPPVAKNYADPLRVIIL